MNSWIPAPPVSEFMIVVDPRVRPLYKLHPWAPQYQSAGLHANSVLK